MKNVVFGAFVFFIAFISCRNDEFEFQKIDQVLNIYIDSAGIDMLNFSLPNAYTSVSANDVYGVTDTSPVRLSFLKDSDTLNYMEYVSGAKLKLIDSSDVSSKIYESKIAFLVTKKLNDSVSSRFSDTLKLNYVMRSDLFQIQKAWYNNQLVFTKVEGQANFIKVSK